MKKWIVIFSMVLFFLAGQPSLAQQPDYQKFGRIATAVVKEDYTGEKLADYKYDGRKTLSGGQIQDSFTFNVKKDGKDVVVKVNVVHNPDKPKDLNLSVIEVQ
ncbi:DUF3889 domain-containing protein [Rossellomorea vietnamensis]|uniref:DUF3889 domain-containing protein n=1 Tax=Rossellomorea vietnamensis TaxID=218284 RepID=A0A5D4MD84_9BACI|nr:DUF3889 domain-containing protein [Rossellomorea vietnamensis]TYR99591.1 DUF3889 domain-containing protein [Rossellomorea vietnamensis]